MTDTMDLRDRHILITGASSGIGRASCILASRMGAQVSLVARGADKLSETLSQMEGGGHRVWVCDLTRLDKIENLVGEAAAALGPLSGLVHCAGNAQGRPLKLCTPTYNQDMMCIHYFAFTELLRAASKKKNSRDRASFVGVSSAAAARGGKAQGAYAAAKGAVEAAIHPFAKELSPRGIRVNCAAFGMVATDSYQIFLDSGGDREGLLRDQYLGVGAPEDAARTICFLLSDASRLITGSTLLADGGLLS